MQLSNPQGIFSLETGGAGSDGVGVGGVGST